MPDADEEVSLESFHVVATASSEAGSFEDGSIVAVEEDPVLGKEVVLLSGSHCETDVASCMMRATIPFLLFVSALCLRA